MEHEPVPRPAPRVGFISHSFVSEAAALNGGFIHVLEVAKRLRRWDVLFFAPEAARAIVAREVPGATFVPAAPRYVPAFLRGAPLVLTRLFCSFRRARELRSCDVVLTSTPFLSDVLPAMFAGRARIALIVQHLQSAPWHRPGSFLTNAVAYVTERLGIALGRRYASLWFINDPAVAARLSLAKTGAAIVRMAHGVDHLAARAATSEPRSGALYVGRLHPTKGLEDLLAAWRIVVASCPGARLTLIGSGSERYRVQLEGLVERLGLRPHVEFFGAVDEATKCAALARARAFAFPSLEEGWGIALAEAMTFALPCVTYDLGAYRDVFTGGRIEIARRDVAAFAKALIRLLQDDELWLQLSHEGAALATSFTWDNAARIEDDAMRALLDRHPDATI